jgi:hypothetical protein
LIEAIGNINLGEIFWEEMGKMETLLALMDPFEGGSMQIRVKLSANIFEEIEAKHSQPSNKMKYPKRTKTNWADENANLNLNFPRKIPPF